MLADLDLGPGLGLDCDPAGLGDQLRAGGSDGGDGGCSLAEGAANVLWYSEERNASSPGPDSSASTDFGAACDRDGTGSESSGSSSSSSNSDDHGLPVQLVDMYLDVLGGDACTLLQLPVADSAAAGAGAAAADAEAPGRAAAATDGEDDAILAALAGCEPNLARAADDMYTPRWIRGIGKEKEGLCPVCFDNGALNWRRM
ncbi:hypothetical protein H4R18_000100, partial [Coemansia javaensis]